MTLNRLSFSTVSAAIVVKPFQGWADGTFSSNIRFAHGGKFEHGFFSGFVSSLGGRYMKGIENNGVKIALSAAIGGTAESLGGGNFGMQVQMELNSKKPRQFDAFC